MNPRIEEREVRGPEPPGSMVRSQLERILGSEIFLRSERLSGFLRFVVERTLDGQGGSLKEQILGSELYGKGPEFDGSADPIVRVDARRLRDKLREYYSQFPRDPIVISVLKGSYVPVFQANDVLLDTTAPAQSTNVNQARGLHWRWLAASIGVAAVLVVIGVARLMWRGRSQQASRAVLITSFPGNKVAPAISPDGRFLAFSSKGPENSGAADIWIKSIETGALRRLTETAQLTETSPAWSPNGQQIAFVRIGQGVFVIPSSGGIERKISKSGTYMDWMPDGKSVLIRDRDRDGPYGIYQVFVDSLERRCLTQPLVGDGDWRFSVSPDGSQLAFIRIEHPGSGDLCVIPTQGGEPRRITNWNGEISGVVWAPDGRDLIFSKGGIWRISATLGVPGRGAPLPGISDPATNLSISRPQAGRAGRLAFQTYRRDLSFRIIDLTAPLVDGAFRAVPFAASKGLEAPGPFSPDGRTFAFVAGQPAQLWISNIEGTRVRQVTGDVLEPSPGSWSPDGMRIVYSATLDGNTDVFVVDVGGGRAKRLTLEPSIDGAASWSRDGRWIYFSSTRAGAVPDVWRIPAEGGSAVRITYHGGMQARESPDGKFLYYLDRPASASGTMAIARLMKVPANGGSETEVLSGLTPLQWSLAETGIYFLSHGKDFDAIDRYTFQDGQVSRLGRLAAPMGAFGGQLSVSPDGRWALVPLGRGQADIMLVDNFR